MEILIPLALLIGVAIGYFAGHAIGVVDGQIEELKRDIDHLEQQLGVPKEQ